MKIYRNSNLFTLLVIFITAQSFHCNNRYNGNECSNYIRDTTYLDLSITKSSPSIKTYDTIWFRSIISDTMRNRQLSDNIIADINELNLQVQPYRIVETNTVPSLVYANIEFNPLLQDGTILTGYYYTGYNFMFRRNKPYNYLKAGYVPGRAGLYLFMFKYGASPSDNSLEVSPSNNYCKQYYGQSYISVDQQNKQYWDSLNVSSLNIQNSDFSVVQKQNTNYFFVRVTN